MKVIYEFWVWIKDVFGFGGLGAIHAFTFGPSKKE